MKERPILFSGEMVKAILDGRKTQTRRVMKPQPPEGLMLESNLTGPEGNWIKRHYKYQEGDHFWVRETWALVSPESIGDDMWYAMHASHDGGFRMHPDSNEEDGVAAAVYRAGGVFWDESGVVKWRPSIFMPRWASRLTLEIVKVRVERVQEITEEDAQAEGFSGRYSKDDDGIKSELFSPIEEFHGTWDSINAKRGFRWDNNPWVWVIEFKTL